MSDTTSNNFNIATESENNWAIRYGAEPTDAHIAKKLGFPKIDNFLNEIFHGGVMAAGNHLYLEVGRINEDGDFQTLKRIHGYSIKNTEDGIKFATEPDGKMFTMVVDGNYTKFSEDPIYQMDPHATKPNQLQSADDSFVFGEQATKIAFQGTERDVMSLYASLLKTTIALNKEDMKYDALQNGAPNGNTINQVLKENLSETAAIMYLDGIANHDPSSIDHFLWGDALDNPEPPINIYECSHIDVIREQVDQLEKTAAEQWQLVKSRGDRAVLGEDKPEEIKSTTESTAPTL